MCPKKEKATDYQWLLSGWQDSNPWSLHRNIWLHLLSSYELSCFGLPAGTLDLHYSNVEINDLMKDLENMCQLKLKSDAVKLEFVAPEEPCFAHQIVFVIL